MVVVAVEAVLSQEPQRAAEEAAAGLRLVLLRQAQRLALRVLQWAALLTQADQERPAL